MNQRSFIPLFVTNFLGVVNDNFLKTLASFVVIGWIADASSQSVFMGVTRVRSCCRSSSSRRLRTD